MGDAFLLGAGFSKAIFPDMPVMSELFKQLKPLVCTEGGVGRAAYQYADGDVETLLSYYAIPNPSDDHVELLRKRIVTALLEHRIGSVLQCQESAVKLGASHMQLGKALVGKWNDQQSHVLTANYDTLVERLTGRLSDTQLSVLYPIPIVPSQAIMGHNPEGTMSVGPEDPVLKLYKLHGSVSWYTNDGESSSGPIYGCVDFGSGPFDPREKLLGDKRRFIAPPVHDKSTLLSHERMRNLWRQARDNALAPAENLYVIGYSLPKTDMAMRTLLWESRLPREQGEQCRKIPLYLVDVKDCLIQHYKDMLGKFYEVKDTYAGGQEPFKRFVEDYVKD